MVNYLNENLNTTNLHHLHQASNYVTGVKNGHLQLHLEVVGITFLDYQFIKL